MSRRRRGVRLEMTSLMDVMFLVLVFFVYSVFDRVVHKGVAVDLPNDPGVFEKGERIVITIRADDSLDLNGVKLSRDEIVSRVETLYRTKMKWPVLISGDRASSLGVGVELLAALKKAGVEKASFQVNGRAK